MEAGYDYLLLRGRLQRRVFKYIGIIVFLFGVALLGTGGAYYGYAAKARADLDSLNVSVPGTAAEGDRFGKQGYLTTVDQSPEWVQGVPPVWPQWTSAENLARPLPSISGAAINSQRLYPGESLTSANWSNPLSYEPLEFRQRLLLEGFQPLETGQLLPGTQAAATRLIVPAIGVDSGIEELLILDLGGSRAYETPDNIVGHIPETANAGEAGSAWFFGHTESPTLGEGSVFLDLRHVPEKLRNGEDVYIITDNGQLQFLYRVTSSQVMHHSEMALYDTGKATIHLVSCVPRLVYDHRLIVTGELIAQKSVN